MSLITEARVSIAGRIPLIDFQPFREGDFDSRRRVAKEIAEACETVGFLYLGNHGIPKKRIEGVFSTAREFFRLPRGVLDDPDLQCTPVMTRGKN